MTAGRAHVLLPDPASQPGAGPLSRRAPEIAEASFGPDHPNLAIRLNNLAALFYATNCYAEAEPLFRRALPIVERALGPEHPYVAASIRGYAQLLRATGRADEAAETEARAEGIRAGPRLVAHDVKRPPQSVPEANRQRETRRVA